MENQENQQNFASPTPSSSYILPPVFPPLPLLPPPDDTKLPNSSRKAPAFGTRNESRPRNFGVRITNKSNAGTGAHEAENMSPSSITMATTQRFYHQWQYFSHQKENKFCATEVMKNPDDSASEKGEGVLAENTSSKEDREQLRKITSPPQPRIPSLKTTPLQPQRTIWSVTPEELAELAKGMAVLRKKPARKLSYAEASKLNLSEKLAVKKNEAMELEQVPRTFKKYYGLPIIPYSEPSYSDAETLEEKETPSETVVGADSEDKLADTLKYSKIFGLSADTPTFYPRQTTDANELIQMLKSSLASKKIAPHMDWWPVIWWGLEMHKLRQSRIFLGGYFMSDNELTIDFSRRRTSRTGTLASDAGLGDLKTPVSCTHRLRLIHRPEAESDKYFGGLAHEHIEEH